MKIAMFCETYMPYINGVVAHIKVLKDSLEELGHEVLIVTAEPACKKYRQENNVIYSPAYRSKKLYGFGVANPISKERYKMVKKFGPDICHIHQEFGIGYFGARYAAKENLPLVYTMHTMYDEYLYYIVPKIFTPLARKSLYNYSKYLSNISTELTGPSDKIVNYFKKIGVTREVNVIPNTVEIDKFSRDNIDKLELKNLKKQLKIPDDKTVAVFVGRLGEEKSVDVLLDNWAESITKADNLQLLIVGSGPSKKDLEKQAKSLGISSMITFAGQVDHDKILPYLAIAKAYITPSLSEVHSISMLEAMSMGLPIIQRHDEVNKNQVVEGLNGYHFKDVTQMAAALKKVKNMSEEEYERLSQNTRQSILNSGSAEMAKKIETIYEKAIAAKEKENEEKKSSIKYGA